METRETQRIETDLGSNELYKLKGDEKSRKCCTDEREQEPRSQSKLFLQAQQAVKTNSPAMGSRKQFQQR